MRGGIVEHAQTGVDRRVDAAALEVPGQDDATAVDEVANANLDSAETLAMSNAAGIPCPTTSATITATRSSASGT